MVLAQVTPIVIDNGVAFALPVVVLLITLTGIVVETRITVSHLVKANDAKDREIDQLKKDRDDLRKDLGETKGELGTTVAVLERMELAFRELRGEIREAIRRSA